jgi:hypothetical protein
MDMCILVVMSAFEGIVYIHMIHYSIYYGVEWLSLIQHLSPSHEGPPHFNMASAT